MTTPERITATAQEAINRATAELGRTLTPEEAQIIIQAVARHFDEPAAPTTALQ